MTMNYKIIYICLIFSAFLSCSTPEPKYGTNYNEKRKEIGLPILNPEWKISSIHRDYEVWINPSFNSRFDNGTHWKKSIDYSSSELLFECDEYAGISNYNTIDGTFRESLVIYYYYKESHFNGFHPKGWECIIYDQSSIEKGEFGERISLGKADSILIKWGISRLNY